MPSKIGIRETDLLNKIVAAIVLAALIFAPWAYGAVEPWSLMLLETGAAAILFLWALKFAVRENFVFHLPVPVFFCLAFLILIFLQIVPGIAATQTGCIS